MLMGTFKVAIDVTSPLFKFGGLLSGTSAVNAAPLCTAGINLSTSASGQHVCVLLLLARGRHCYAGRTIR